MDRFFIGGQWVQPSSDATIKVIDSGTEELFFSVAEAQAADIEHAMTIAGQLRTGVTFFNNHNAIAVTSARSWRVNASGIGREGIREGCRTSWRPIVI